MTDTRNTAHSMIGPLRRPLISIITAFSVALLTISSLSSMAFASRVSLPVTLPNSISPHIAGAQLVGHHSAADQMTIGLVLQTSHQAEQRSLIAALYNPHSPLYHHWLQTGEFDARFAPDSKQVAAARIFLTQAGLHLLSSSPSATLLLATGTVNQVEAAFHTSISDYRTPVGRTFFANSTSVQIPTSLGGSVLGVLGLSNLATERSHSAPDKIRPNLPPPYGGGPFGRGLTPSQLTSIYDATPVYTKLNDKGQDITLAVFELSGYTGKDISVYEKQFNLPRVPLTDKLVLGGAIPVTAGGSPDYAAGEVELDIELQIAMAPGAKQLLVYQAPNTEIGDVAEYLQIARDNRADAISSSWGSCEYLTTSSAKLGEFQAFSQMATQGQSIFSASGDNGAYTCLPYKDSNLTGTGALQSDDPSAQPYMTAVGGTSFQGPDGVTTFDPGTNPHPSYPGTAKELTWLDTPCTPAACDGGASGGGVSRYWGAPDYQYFAGTAVPGFVESGLSHSGAYCNQPAGVFCRELPDVSLDADPSTGYAIYCTDKGDSSCDPASGFAINGWIRFGGTSCSAPLWAGIAALIDHQNKGRTGLLNYYFYSFDSSAGYKSQFHDITTYNNGYYPARAAYDMSTGIGSADIYHLVKP